MALADSIFFSAATSEARGTTALYLLLTMAPFALVAPLIGPAIDRIAGRGITTVLRGLLSDDPRLS